MNQPRTWSLSDLQKVAESTGLEITKYPNGITETKSEGFVAYTDEKTEKEIERRMKIILNK